MKAKKLIALLLAAVMLLSTFTACGGGDDTVVVGYIGDLSNADAYVGVPAQLFLQDYFDELNKNGGLLGKQVKFVAYDMQPDNATDGVNATNRLVNEDHAICILGPSSSSCAIPMADICDAAHVPFIATSATNEKVTIAEDGTLHPYAFRVCFIDPYQGTAGADYCYNDGYRRVALIEILGQPYSQSLCDCFQAEFEKIGGTIVDRIGINNEDTDFRAQLTALNEKGVDAIYVPAGTYVPAAYISNQARDLGMDCQFIFPEGVYDDALLESAGAAIEGCIMTNPIYANNPQYNEFKEKHDAKHPEWKANIFTYLAYDAVELFMYAVKDSNSLDPEKIRDSLENAKDVKLYTDEHFTVDPATHNPLNKMVAIITVENGQFVLRDSFYPTFD